MQIVAVDICNPSRRLFCDESPGHAESLLAENLNKQRILDYLKACYAGDIERASSYYDDEIDFIAYAPITVFPTLGQKRGKAAMTGSLQGLIRQYSPMEYDVTSIVTEDDRVAVMFDLRLHVRGSDRVISLRIANFYTMHRGRIRTYRQFLDSFDAVQQKLRRDLADALRPGEQDLRLKAD